MHHQISLYSGYYLLIIRNILVYVTLLLIICIIIIQTNYIFKLVYYLAYILFESSEQNQSVLFYSTHACLYLSLTVFLKWDPLI